MLQGNSERGPVRGKLVSIDNLPCSQDPPQAWPDRNFDSTVERRHYFFAPC